MRFTNETRLGILLLAAALLTAPALGGRAAEVRVEAFKLLNEGVSAYSRGLYDEAVAKLERCTGIALNSFRANYYHGLALTATRRYAEAVEALNVALDLEPQDLQALVAYGDAQLKLGDVAEARAGYARALRIRPAFAPALDGTARAYEAQADDERALDHYKQAIRSNKTYAPAYTHLGELYMRQGRVREAVRLLEEAVEIRPDYAEGHNRLAVAYGRMGLHNQAVATIHKAIELDPTDPYHPQTLGWLQLGQSLLAAAEESFKQALGLERRLPQCRLGLAQIFRRRGDYEMAVLQIESALNLPDIDSVTETNLREVQAAIEAEELRLAELETTLVTDAMTPAGYAELASIHARRGAWRTAAELQRKTTASDANDEWLAYLLFQDGQYREAQQIYSRLAKAGGRLDLQLNAAVSHALLGNDLAAEREYRALLEQEPDHARARLYLANSQLRLGRNDEASLNYQAFLQLDRTSESAERVRRILAQVAPGVLPDDSKEALVPPDPPAPPTEREESGS